MTRLPSDQCRRVITLRYRDGLKYREIAQTLGISEVAVYRHIRHALDILRQTLRE
ncbi:MAG: ECF-type sigma factor [Alloprevotella sp.]|nr:ECF-type sigma factor [Alloprevotella sp.]